SEVDGGVQVLHRECGAARDVAAGSWWNRAGHRGQYGGPGGAGPQVPAAAGGGRRWLDRTCHSDCGRGRDGRGAVSGVQGGAEGSYRRLSIRIGPATFSDFAFISPGLAGSFSVS